MSKSILEILNIPTKDIKKEQRMMEYNNSNKYNQQLKNKYNSNSRKYQGRFSKH